MDILLIPGFAEKWVFLSTIASHLNAQGYRVHVIKELNYHTSPIEKSAQIVMNYILSNKLQKVVLLSHSKGGIIAKWILDKPDYKDLIGQSISITSPYKGTLVGYLFILSLNELIPNSKVIKTILKIHQNNSKVFNFYAEFDNHILPNKNAILEGAKNIKIDIIGHTRILEETKTKHEISRFLNQS